jgi:hypothetical protein
MIRNLSFHTLLTLTLLAIPGFATADTLTLKSGQVHEGKITAEEEGRIQIKLENSGVRLWFPRDHILEFNIDEPVADEEDQEARTGADNPPSGLEDDIDRARKMLEELRQQQLTPSTQKKKKQKNRTTITKPPKRKKKGATLELTDEAVGALIQTLRNHHNIYKRLDACKSLGKAKATQAIPDLIHALDNEAAILRGEANKALIKITGKNFGFKSTDKRNVRLWAIEKWEDWYAGIKREKAKEDLNSWF